MKAEPRACGRPALSVYSPAEFEAFIPREQWQAFREAIRSLREAGASFALGGGLAVSFYTGLWRNTKDLDLYILPAEREPAIAAITKIGMSDYYETAAYDRSWIYRGHREGTIVDLIWALANGIAEVDEDWLECGGVARLEGETVPLVAPEEIVWSKVHVVQRDRCDWPDLLNLLYAAGPSLDWGRLLRRTEPDEAPVASLLTLFAWVAPARAAELPTWLWPRLGLRPPEPGPERDQRRIDLLDSRPWFSPLPPSGWKKAQSAGTVARAPRRVQRRAGTTKP